MNKQFSHRPRKRFGQHFLIDQSVLFNIANSINAEPEQHLVEIGPGQGALTEFLLSNTPRLDVVEIDRDLATMLKAEFTQYPQFTVHQIDVLKFNFAEIANSKQSLRVVGNLPYNISTPLLFHLFSFLEWIEDMHFLMQKEVVDRLTAEVGAHNYGRLSVMAQYYCDNTSLFTVWPEAFDPPPKVDSAFIRMQPKEQPIQAQDINVFEKVVKHAFMHRRKTLSNTLKDIVSKEALIKLDIDPTLRPQALSVTDYVKIANTVSIM